MTRGNDSACCRCAFGPGNISRFSLAGRFSPAGPARTNDLSSKISRKRRKWADSPGTAEVLSHIARIPNYSARRVRETGYSIIIPRGPLFLSRLTPHLYYRRGAASDIRPRGHFQNSFFHQTARPYLDEPKTRLPVCQIGHECSNRRE